MAGPWTAASNYTRDSAHAFLLTCLSRPDRAPMDKLVSRQTQFKKALDKQLVDLEVTQRQTEARRQKQIRDLGVDLSRIQTSTRNLQYIDDLPTGRYQHRRASLPAISSPDNRSPNLESSRQSRSRRRLSCTPKIPQIAPDSPECPETKGSQCTPNQHAVRPQAGPDSEKSKTAPTDKRNDSSSAMAVRRGSFGAAGNNDGHNVTTVYIHEDKQVSPQDSASSGEHTPEEDLPPEPHVLRGRRASEPAVGGYFIRRLQATAHSENPLFPHRSTLESEQLKRSIQTYLPSDIVAEEDEEDGETTRISKSTEDISSHFPSSGNVAKSSTAGTDPNAGVIISNSLTSRDVNSKNVSTDSTRMTQRHNSATKSGNQARQRRSSEGDVIPHVARAFSLEGRGPRYKPPGNARIVSTAGRNSHIYTDADNEGSDVWQAVRKCRYLRGYDPPEMRQPDNLREFVFGCEDTDSLPPETK